MNPEQAVVVTPAYNLTEFGIPAEQCTWPRVGLSNADLTCALFYESRSTSTESVSISSCHTDRTHRGHHESNVNIIDATGKVVSRSRTIAQSAKLHPTRNIIALKAENHIQVYNFETQNLLSETEVHSDVVYWRWANEELLVLVTETSVLLWHVFTEHSQPELLCIRHFRLSLCEIVNCSVDDSHRWLALNGLQDHGKGSVEGITQVYSADYGVSQCIDSQTSTFITHRYESNIHESTVLCLASRPLDSPLTKLHSIELGPSIYGAPNLKQSTSEINIAKEEPSSSSLDLLRDFPVSVQADASHGVIFVTTKFGQLIVAELESAIPLFLYRISHDITFASSLNNLSILTVVCKSSQVLRISVNWLYVIKQTLSKLNQPDVARRLRNARGMEHVDLLHDLDE